jgi:non-homologous end joining protein Ku
MFFQRQKEEEFGCKWTDGDVYTLRQFNIIRSLSRETCGRTKREKNDEETRETTRHDIEKKTLNEHDKKRQDRGRTRIMTMIIIKKKEENRYLLCSQKTSSMG